MRRGWWLALALWGCSSPITIDPLARGALAVVVSFDVPATQPPLLAATLRYPVIGECPDADLAAELDGVAMARVPAATGVFGTDCRITFQPGAAPSPRAGDSTVSLTNGGAGASLTVERLLEPRMLAPVPPTGGDVRAGDVLELTWSTDSDSIDSASASFASGAEKHAASTQIAGSAVHVTVPELSAGAWTVNVGVVAKAHVAACAGLAACSADVIRAGASSVNVR